MKNVFNVLLRIDIIILLLFLVCGCGSNKTTEIQTEVELSFEVMPILDTSGIPTRMQSEGDFIQLRSGPLYSFFHPGQDSLVYVYAEAQVAPLNIKGSRMPLNLALVIDLSGSMQGEKLRHVIEASKMVIRRLNKEDRISIVTYSDEVNVLVSSRHISDSTALLSLLDEITADRTTNLSGGLFEGLDQVELNSGKGYLDRVLLLSDGIANMGIVDPKELLEKTRKRFASSKVGLSTFGVGVDYNEDLMQDLTESRGNYYFIESSGDIASILSRELEDLMQVAARDMLISIRYPEGLIVRNVYGYPEYHNEGQMVNIPWGDGYSGDKKGVLVEFSYAKSLKDSQVFETKLHYIRVDTKMRIEERITTSVNPETNDSLINSTVDSTVLEQYVLFRRNYLWSDIMELVDYGDQKVAIQKLDSMTFWINNSVGYGSFSDQVYHQDSLIIKYKNDLDAKAAGDPSEFRSFQKENKSYNYSIRKKK